MGRTEVDLDHFQAIQARSTVIGVVPLRPGARVCGSVQGTPAVLSLDLSLRVGAGFHVFDYKNWPGGQLLIVRALI